MTLALLAVLLTTHLALADDSNPNASPSTNTLAAPAPKPESAQRVPDAPRHAEEKFQLQIRTNAPPAVTGSTNAPASTNSSFHWDVSWRGWNGLQLSISQKIPLKSPRELLGLPPLTNSPSFHLEQLKFTATFGARLEVDAAAFKTSDTLDIPDDVQVRRARLIARGDSILLFPFTYKVELGYVPHRFNLNEAWISSQRIDYLGYLVAGFFSPPMGLDLLTSSRDLTFMEPASVLQALAPANEAGIQIGHPVFNQRATWTLGIFGGGYVLNTEYGNASEHYGNLIGRLSWLAVDHLAPDRPADNSYLHLGLSANAQYSASSTVQYRSRPESFLAPHLIDTGQINANAAGTVGLEAAWVNGPFCLQGESIDSFVRENTGEGLNFVGFYGAASWFLTGESRPYDPSTGTFSRLVPLRNFNFGKAGAWGAFELAGRVSYTDLTDVDISGGRLSLLMGEFNWYLHSHVRWMFNAGGGRVDGGPHDGRLVLFQSRIGIDF